MNTFYVVLLDVHCGEVDEDPRVGLMRGDWMCQDGNNAGHLGYRDPNDIRVFNDPDGHQEAFMAAECSSSSFNYILVPLSCLSEPYDDRRNLWIVADPQQVQGNEVTLMEVAEDAKGERVSVTLEVLAENLGVSVEAIHGKLATLVVSRDDVGWFNPGLSDNSGRYWESLPD